MRVPLLLLIILYLSVVHAMNENALSKNSSETNNERETGSKYPLLLRQIRYYGKNREYLIRPLPFSRMLEEISVHQPYQSASPEMAFRSEQALVREDSHSTNEKKEKR